MAYSAALDSFTTKTDTVDDVMAADVNSLQTAIVNIETALGIVIEGTAADLVTRLAQSISAAGNLNFATATVLTISAGSITPTQNYHRIDTQSGDATDDLDTITAMSEGHVLWVRANHADRTVVLKHGTGNINLFGGVDVTLDDAFDTALLIYDDVLDKWIGGRFSSGTSIDGSGVANRLAYWSDANTVGSDAGFTVNATTDVLTVTGDDAKIVLKKTGAAGIQLDHNDATGDFVMSLSPANLAANKRITFPAVDGTTALGAGTLTSATTNDVTGASHTHAITGSVGLAGNGTAQYQFVTSGASPYTAAWSDFYITGTTGGKTTLAVTNTKTLTLTSAGDYNLTIPASGTAALLGTTNTFTVAQMIDGTADAVQLTVQGHSSQTANLQVWETSAGTDLAAINGVGEWGIGSAPTTGFKLTVQQDSSGAGNVNALNFLVIKTEGSSSPTVTAVNGGIYADAWSNPGTVAVAQVFRGGQTVRTGAGQTSTITDAMIFTALSPSLSGDGTEVITSNYGFYANNQGATGIENAYGIYLASQSGAAANYSIVTNGGSSVFNEVGDATTDFRVESDTEANMIFLDANADTDGALYLGGSTNGVKISKGGVVTYLGTAKRELEVRPAFVGGLIGVKTKPTSVTIGAFTGYSMPIYNSDDEELFWRMNVPGRWDGTTNPVYHLVVCTAGAETEGDDFQFQLSWNHSDGTTGVVPATTTDVTALGDCTAGHTDQYSVFTLTFAIDYDVADPHLLSHDVLAGRVRRIASGGTEVAGEIIVLDHHVNFTVDKIFGAVV